MLPDPVLSSAVEANRAFLLLAHAGDRLVGVRLADDAVAVLGALDRYGFHDEARQVLASLHRSDERRPAAAALVALAAHWRLTRDRALVEDLAAAIAAAVRVADRMPAGEGVAGLRPPRCCSAPSASPTPPRPWPDVRTDARTEAGDRTTTPAGGRTPTRAR